LPPTANLKIESGFHEDDRYSVFLSFGYPEKLEALTWAKRAGGRKPLDAIVHTERW
jgi:nitroreductase